MTELSNEEKLNILAGARSLGFEYHNATAEQIMAAFNGVK